MIIIGTAVRSVRTLPPHAESVHAVRHRTLHLQLRQTGSIPDALPSPERFHGGGMRRRTVRVGARGRVPTGAAVRRGDVRGRPTTPQVTSSGVCEA